MLTLSICNWSNDLFELFGFVRLNIGDFNNRIVTIVRIVASNLGWVCVLYEI